LLSLYRPLTSHKPNKEWLVTVKMFKNKQVRTMSLSVLIILSFFSVKTISVLNHYSHMALGFKPTTPPATNGNDTTSAGGNDTINPLSKIPVIGKLFGSK
jgi:hypothetical protein